MSYRYEIDVEKALVLSFVSGVLTTDDMHSARRTMAADPRFSPDQSQFVDMSGVTGVEVDMTMIREFAAHSIHRPHTRIAVVVQRKDVFGMLRMYETFRELAGIDQRIRLFETAEAAMAWLEERAPSA